MLMIFDPAGKVRWCSSALILDSCSAGSPANKGPPLSSMRNGPLWRKPDTFLLLWGNLVFHTGRLARYAIPVCLRLSLTNYLVKLCVLSSQGVRNFTPGM